MAKRIRAARNLVFSLVRQFNAMSMRLSARLGQTHQLIMPFATYAPWLDDAEFLELYRQVEPLTCTGLYQCWELWQLAQQNSTLGGDLLEVGVWKGATASILGRALLRANSGAHLFCCDTFRGLVKSSERDAHLRDGALQGPRKEDARALLHRTGVRRFTILEGIFPDETGEVVKDHRFKLVHIDVDTRRSAQEVAEWVWPRMPVGGVIAFQDYGFHRTGGIAAYVDELRGQPGLLVIHNLNGSALVVKTADGVQLQRACEQSPGAAMHAPT